jgi:hypothetical protein
VSEPEQLRDRALRLSDAAELAWAEAMRGHIMAPPDPGFANRLRASAAAARRRAQAARAGAEVGLRWVPRPGALRSQPPPELRPNTGRAGSPALWETFDLAVGAVNKADAGTDLIAVAEAAEALAEAAEAIAADVDREREVDMARTARTARSS